MEVDGKGEELVVECGVEVVLFLGVLEGCGCGDGVVYDFGGFDEV